MITPPIRRITNHRIVSTSMNNNQLKTSLRERSNSSSTSSPKSSNKNSLRSFSTDPSLNDDDDEQWNPSRQIRMCSHFSQIISNKIL